MPTIPLTPRSILIAVLIVLLAYALRAVVVWDRAHNDPVFDPPPEGSDQLHYLAYAAGWEAGTWPDGPFWYQPGLVYYFVGIRALVGHSLANLRLVTSLTGALACGFMIGAGWLLTRRVWGGYLAGLLLAFYPVAIFFATEPLDTGLSTFYVALFLFLMLWQREKLAAWRSAALGLTLGLAIISRTNLALLGPAWLLFLALYVPKRRALIAHAALSFATLSLAIAPVTLWNWQAGSSQLITRVGMEEIYRASSRDSPGIYVSRLPAFDVVDDGQYAQALLNDLRRDPRHFIELQLRKLSLFWSALEPGNNIEYAASGENASPLLRAIPLDFRILSIIGLLGLIALLDADRRLGIILAAMVAALFLGVMTIWVEARVRQPITIPLIAAAAFLAVHLASNPRRFARRYTLPLLLLLGISACFDWAIDNLPQQRPVAALPAGLRPLDVTFDHKLRLVGWRPLDEWPAAGRGWGEFRRSYVIDLYWQLLEPTADDYNMYIAYRDGERYAGRDTVIGAISYRPRPTSTWQPGDIYHEIMGFRLPPSIPAGRGGEITLGVYRVEGEFTYTSDTRKVINVPATSLPGQPGFIVLQPFAVFDLHQPPAVPDGLTPSSLVFGDKIALKGFDIQAQDGLTLSLHWEALAEIDADYSLFVHVMDASSQLAAQFDGQPRLPTSVWPPGYPLIDSLTLPAPPGQYQVFIGFYDPATLERLPAGVPDNRPLLASLNHLVEESGGSR